MGEEKRRRRWPPPAVGLAVIGIVLLAGSVIMTVAIGSLAGAIVGLVLACVGTIALSSAGFAIAVPRLIRFVVAHIGRAKGIAVIDTLAPGEVMQRLLARVLGDHEANEHVAQSILGGAGRDVRGADLSAAGATHVHYELRNATEPATFVLTSTVRYSFSRPVTDLSMTLFTTSDARLRDIIVAACDRPLFDWNYVSDADQWQAAARDPIVDVGVRLLDAAGSEHATDIQAVTAAWVRHDDWGDHLSLFRHSVRSRPAQHPNAYVKSLGIYTIDLAALAPPGVTPVAVVGLTLRQTSIQPDVGNVFWQPQFPCLLELVAFDATDFDESDGTRREFSIVPFLTGTALVDEAKNWVPAEELKELRVDTWALPGHGFILLWRRAAAPQRQQDQPGPGVDE